LASSNKNSHHLLHPLPITHSLEFDLHSQILSSLASTLAKDSTTQADEVQRLIRAGPRLPSPSQPSTPKPYATGVVGGVAEGAAEPVLAEGGLMVI
jgi:hypothetical protein